MGRRQHLATRMGMDDLSIDTDAGRRRSIETLRRRVEISGQVPRAIDRVLSRRNNFARDAVPRLKHMLERAQPLLYPSTSYHGPFRRS
jgi:hypothetical protein